jgi:pimeloyl-ACP methyl ester carboxylesterase
MITKTIDFAGETLHYADFGGQGPTFVLVHGLGGSHMVWAAVGSSFARRGRTLAIDLPGFGRTPRSPRGTSLRVMGEALARFIDAISPEPVHLVGNSMGGTLSILEGHARPARVASALLVCPALPAPIGTPMDPRWLKTLVVASLPWGHLLLRRHAKRVGSERLLRDLLALCCVDASKVPRDIVDSSIAFSAERAAMPWNERSFSEATRSIMAELVLGKRVHNAVLQPGAPTLIIHGKRDVLVDVSTSRRAVAMNPKIDLIELPDLGHTPQLEAPDTLMEAASGWVDRAVSLAGRQDTHSSPVRATRRSHA